MVFRKTRFGGPCAIALRLSQGIAPAMPDNAVIGTYLPGTIPYDCGLDFAARGGCGECRQGTRGIEALGFEFVGYLLGDLMATTLIDQCDD